MYSVVAPTAFKYPFMVARVMAVLMPWKKNQILPAQIAGITLKPLIFFNKMFVKILNVTRHFLLEQIFSSRKEKIRDQIRFLDRKQGSRAIFATPGLQLIT